MHFYTFHVITIDICDDYRCFSLLYTPVITADISLHYTFLLTYLSVSFDMVMGLFQDVYLSRLKGLYVSFEGSICLF